MKEDWSIKIPSSFGSLRNASPCLAKNRAESRSVRTIFRLYSCDHFLNFCLRRFEQNIESMLFFLVLKFISRLAAATCTFDWKCARSLPREDQSKKKTVEDESNLSSIFHDPSFLTSCSRPACATLRHFFLRRVLEANRSRSQRYVHRRKNNDRTILKQTAGVAEGFVFAHTVFW